MDKQENSESRQPSFSAPLWAALRQGAKELSQILPAFPGRRPGRGRAGDDGRPYAI